ncbi:MAG: hypothetical protein ACRDQ0_15040, partial [Pseudonocardia sp.]
LWPLWLQRARANELSDIHELVRDAQKPLNEQEWRRQSLAAVMAFQGAQRSGGWRARLAKFRLSADLRKKRQGDHDLVELRKRLEWEMATFAAEEAQANVVQALGAARANATSAGFSRRHTLAAGQVATLGWLGDRFALIFGVYSAVPSEASKVANGESKAVAEHYGITRGSVTQIAGWVSLSPVVFGIWLAARGDSMIARMTRLTNAAALGLAGLAVFGIGGGVVVFALAGLMMGYWDAATGPMKARWDQSRPAVMAELRQQRNGQWNSGFKAGQMAIVPILGVGYSVAGVAATSFTAAVVFTLFSVAVMRYLRGGKPIEATEKPDVKKALAKSWGQALGTRHGVMRKLLSIQTGVVLTGLPVYVLMGSMVDIARDLMFLPGMTTFWRQVLGAGLAGTLLLVGPRFVATGSGLQWPKIFELLGGKGQSIRAEAGVLVRLLLGTAPVLVALAVVLRIAPGYGLMWVFLAVNAVITGWARNPMNDYLPTSAAKTLWNSGKGAAAALGGILAGFLLATPAAATIAAAKKALERGADPAVVAAEAAPGVHSVLTVVVGLASVVAVGLVVWVLAFRRLHIAPLPVLADSLSPETFTLLQANGYGSVGEVAGLVGPA